MSARGWAGILESAAGIVDTECGGEDGERRLCAELRELAALLDRITPEMAREATAALHGHVVAEWSAQPVVVRSPDRAVCIVASDIIAALSRGPAEQQETGR